MEKAKKGNTSNSNYLVELLELFSTPVFQQCMHKKTQNRIEKAHLYKLQKVSEHIIIFQSLQLPDSHWANLSIRVVTVQQLHGQTNIQTTEQEQNGDRWWDTETTVDGYISRQREKPFYLLSHALLRSNKRCASKTSSCFPHLTEPSSFG